MVILSEQDFCSVLYKCSSHIRLLTVLYSILCSKILASFCTRVIQPQNIHVRLEQGLQQTKSLSIF